MKNDRSSSGQCGEHKKWRRRRVTAHWMVPTVWTTDREWMDTVHSTGSRRSV